MTDEVNESGDSDASKVVRACGERLNSSAEWTPFKGYPGSLALCVLDAIWSVSTRYPITRGVIQRYRGQRRWQGNPDEDGLPELLVFYGAVGGVDSFIDTVGTRNRVSTQPDAMRKGEAVFLAATALHNLGVDTAEQFRSADGTLLGEQVREAWCSVPGQRSGVSWRYLRMLAGLPDVKPDRMVIRFLAAALHVDERSIDADRAVVLVQAAAEHFDVDQRALDHEIWEYQSGRPRATTGKVSGTSSRTLPDRSSVRRFRHWRRSMSFQRRYIIRTSRSGETMPASTSAARKKGSWRRCSRSCTRSASLIRWRRRLRPPDFYIFSLLEGAIRRCAGAGDDRVRT